MMSTTVGDPKRKAVDEAFERLFSYPWGTQFHLDESKMNSTTQELVRIFGPTSTARIIDSRGSVGISNKRLKIDNCSRNVLNYKDIELPEMEQTTVMETSVFAGKTVQTTKKKQTKRAATAAKKSKANVDNVLAQLAGPSKMSTVAKTNNDWESFKESDKQLQDELEKRAQGKDAFLVKQDFLKRVDHRTFELEKEGRDRERAKRTTS
jgi:hypothetical protein